MGISRHKTQKTYGSYAVHSGKEEAIGDKRRAQQTGGRAALAVLQEPLLQLTAAPSMTASVALVMPGKENVPPTLIDATVHVDGQISAASCLVAAPARRVAFAPSDHGTALAWSPLPAELPEDRRELALGQRLQDYYGPQKRGCVVESSK
jgi:hypothetical protein